MARKRLTDAQRRAQAAAYARAWRKANPEKTRAAKLRARARLTLEQRERIREQHRLCAAALRAERKANGTHRPRTLTRAQQDASNARNRAYRQRHAERLRRARAERIANDPAYAARMKAIARRTYERLRDNQTAARAIAIEQTIRAALPASLPAIARDDVYQALAVALLLNGQITPADVKTAISDFWRTNPVMAGRELSLDAPCYSAEGDSRERWIDRLQAR